MRINVNNLTFAYDYRTVLKDISFKVSSGDFLVICGNNGSGKSTLIKCILGINKVPINTITLDDIDISEYTNFKNIGYVPQKFDSFNYEFPITVDEVLSSSKITNVSNDVKLKLIDDMGLTKLQHENINNLSGGQLQRVFIVRALMNDPKLIIFDEPTVGVDYENIIKFYETVNTLNKLGITIILITHHVDQEYISPTAKIEMINGEAHFFDYKEGSDS